MWVCEKIIYSVTFLGESWHLSTIKTENSTSKVLGGALDNCLWFLLPEEFFARLAIDRSICILPDQWSFLVLTGHYWSIEKT